VQTDKLVGAPFEVTGTTDGEIGDADWDLIGYREQNSAGPSDRGKIVKLKPLD
jgi:hypothetical protein